MWKLSKNSNKRMAGIDERLIDICHRALAISSIDFGIPEHGGLRTTECQRQLYINEKSQCDGTVKKSYHQTGRALDFYAYVNGKASWDEHHLTQVAAALLQAASELGHRVQWGGHWKGFKDMPHIQLSGG